MLNTKEQFSLVIGEGGVPDSIDHLFQMLAVFASVGQIEPYERLKTHQVSEVLSALAVEEEIADFSPDMEILAFFRDDEVSIKQIGDIYSIVWDEGHNPIGLDIKSFSHLKELIWQIYEALDLSIAQIAIWEACEEMHFLRFDQFKSLLCARGLAVLPGEEFSNDTELDNLFLQKVQSIQDRLLDICSITG